MDIFNIHLADWLGVNADLLLLLFSPLLWMGFFGAGLLLSVIVWGAVSGFVKFFEERNSGPPHNWMS